MASCLCASVCRWNAIDERASRQTQKFVFARVRTSNWTTMCSDRFRIGGVTHLTWIRCGSRTTGSAVSVKQLGVVISLWCICRLLRVYLMNGYTVDEARRLRFNEFYNVPFQLNDESAACVIWMIGKRVINLHSHTSKSLRKCTLYDVFENNF